MMRETMIYEDESGGIFEGETAGEVVKAMSQAKLSDSKSLASYRRATARRIKELRNLTIETGDDIFFLDSLVRHGLMKRID